jgi:large subunit ribosomal protein L4
MVLNKTLTYEVFDLDGNVKPNSTISIDLKSTESGSKHLLHKALVIQEAQKRQGTVSCKTRSEVTGGGKKPWKQKGTGRARSGSSNSPLWRGGGVAFGPKPKVCNKKINSKEKKLALTTALCSLSTKTIVVENSFVNVVTPNTKGIVSKINKLGFCIEDSRILLISHEHNNNLMLSTRNIPNLQLLYSETLNLKDVMLAKKIIITEKAISNLTKL